MIFFITGFTAVGKTSYGQQLAEELDIDFIDLDAYIEATHHIRIDVLFADGREEEFRTLEGAAVHRLIQEQKNDCVIALGGGTMCTPQMADLLLRSGICVYLHQETASILSQLDFLLSNRPQYRGLSRSEATEHILRRYGERLPFYRRSQLQTLVNRGFSPKKLANSLKLLTNRPHSL